MIASRLFIKLLLLL